MKQLSVIIPARNEEFLARTIKCCIKAIRGDTEIIAVLDGAWGKPPIEDDPRVRLIHHSVPIGQRAATNEGCRLSEAKYIMKLDAHCMLSEGFDVNLIATASDVGRKATIVPRQYNLHAFNWKCRACGKETYQGPTPTTCGKQNDDGKEVKGCGAHDFKKIMIWQPRWHRRTDAWRFDHELHFQYWPEYNARPEAKANVIETMSFIGACWFMHHDRWDEIEGLDEQHGSWGQVGTEIACKSWLSGGRLVTAKQIWYAHLFRTQGGDFSFPYPNPGIAKARKRSKQIWINNAWPKQVHPLSWLIDKFKPIVDWHDAAGREELKRVKEAAKVFGQNPPAEIKKDKPVEPTIKESLGNLPLPDEVAVMVFLAECN